MDRTSSRPLYLQISDAIRRAVATGQLAEGSRLPATRELSERLSVNRTTVVEAYRTLRSEGWVRSGVGSGTFVRAPEGRVAGGSDGGDGSFWSGRSIELPRPETGRNAPSGPEGTIRFTSPTADPTAFPLTEFRDALDAVLEREGASCLDYAPPEGYRPLRELIASRLAGKGIAVDPMRVILVNGSQQGIDLMLRLLVPPQRTLLVEAPTYQLVLRAARALGREIRGVPMDGQGLRVDRLAQVLDATRPGMLYTMPVFQNPTGLTLSPERRRALLEIAVERGLPIVEDHFDADLDYHGDAPPPLLAEGPSPAVILLGTFSKILFPGLRIGWLVVPEPLIGPLSELKVCADLSNGLITQMALHEFCVRGALDRHLDRVRERNRSRLAALLESLETFMPPAVRFTRPTGGMTLWVRLPKGVDSEMVSAEALRQGVAVTPGTAFILNGGGRDALRLCFVREEEERIREGIRRLAGTIRELCAGRPARELEGAAAPML